MRHPRPLPRLRRTTAALAVFAAATVAVTTLTAPAVPAAHAAARSTVIDGYARYEPQNGCVSVPQPGTDALHRWILRSWPGTLSSGMVRDCGSGGLSEHKDGRAIDWAVDVRDPDGKEAGYGFIDKVLATDARGNTHALARRMGVMYIIFDDTIWSAYRGFEPVPYKNSSCATVKGCSDSLRHLNHVHVSLSRAGGAAQTSWYRARNIPAQPVLIPGTRQLDAEATAVFSLEVPADGTEVRTPFKLTRGTSYTLLADGLVRYGTGSKITDANCGYSPAAATFAPLERLTAPTQGLLVNDTLPWGETCAETSTYTTTWTAGRTAPLRLRYADPADPGDNDGTVRVHLVRSDIIARSVVRRSAPDVQPEPVAARRGLSGGPLLQRESVTVAAAADRGRATTGRLVAGARYRVTVTGVASDGGVTFDGACTRYADRLRYQHTLNPANPGADHHGIYVAGSRVTLLRSRDRAERCDGRDHTYTGVFTAPVDGRVRIKTWDPFDYTDNTGTLAVTLRKLGR